MEVADLCHFVNNSWPAKCGSHVERLKLASFLVLARCNDLKEKLAMVNVFEGTTLYVKFIPFSMGEDELKNLFQHFGKIYNVYVSTHTHTKLRAVKRPS